MKALIYCRVSSDRQALDGHGIDSQEQRCRNRARDKGYSIARVFPDEGVSGGLFERPGMKEMIAYIDSHPGEQYVVIFDDLSRFARDLKVHIQLKAEFTSRDVKLECLNFDFEESEESEYAEMILAAGNQYQRKQNKRQVIQKMKARAEMGYWPFCLPPGLKNQKDPLRGKIATPDEPIASIFKEAIEGYRDRILLTQQDVTDFIQARYKDLNVNRKISLHGVQCLLTEILYAGYIEYPHWGISKRKAAHDGFITIETYEEVQRILKDKTRPKIRRDTNPEFPLRGLVLCSLCRKPLTASFNTSRNGQRYPNYFCKTKGCHLQNKIMHKKDLEENFLAILHDLKLENEMTSLAIEVLIDVWTRQQEQQETQQLTLKRDEAQLKANIDSFIERISKTTDNKLVGLYEQKLLELQEKRESLMSKVTPPKFTQEHFGTATRKIMEVLENPAAMWQNGDLNDRLTVYFMHFDQKLVYDKVLGFGTARLGQSASIIRSLGSEKISSVEMPGNEPGSEGIHRKLLQA